MAQQKVTVELPRPEECGPLKYESYAQAANSVMGKVARLMGFKRKLAPNFPKTAPLYIFNISDQELAWREPGFARMVVPACEKGQDYSAPLEIPGILSEEYLQDQSTEFNHYNAVEIAYAILKIGPGMRATLDETKKGFFISDTNPPHSSRLNEARAKYNQYCDQLIDEADHIIAAGESKGPNGQMINESHKRALVYRKQTRDWARGTIEMVDCPGCQQHVPKFAKIHAACGAVLDWKGAVELGLKKREDVPRSQIWWKEPAPAKS
jgi:hypothetical protein